MILESIERAKSWDLHAFGNLYDASYDQIYRMLFHRTLDHTFAEDVISDVYMKAMRSISGFRGKSEGEFYSWLRKIAYNTLMDHLRHESPIDSLHDLEWELGYNEHHAKNIDNKSLIEKILTYLDDIPERDRIILTMRIWDDLSYEEISLITGQSIVNAKKIVSRTLMKISANVEQLVILSFLLNHVFFH